MNQATPPEFPLPPLREDRYGPVQSYAQGEIQAYHGIVPKWLLLIYLILFVWGVVYLFKYWGGPGPGLAY